MNISFKIAPVIERGNAREHGSHPRQNRLRLLIVQIRSAWIRFAGISLHLRDPVEKAKELPLLYPCKPKKVQGLDLLGGLAAVGLKPPPQVGMPPRPPPAATARIPEKSKDLAHPSTVASIRGQICDRVRGPGAKPSWRTQVLDFRTHRIEQFVCKRARRNVISSALDGPSQAFKKQMSRRKSFFSLRTVLGRGLNRDGVPVLAASVSSSRTHRACPLASIQVLRRSAG